jgi:integrase
MLQCTFEGSACEFNIHEKMMLNVEIPVELIKGNDCEISIHFTDGKVVVEPKLMKDNEMLPTDNETHQDETHLFIYMRKCIDELKEEGRIRTAETYTSTLASFRRFRKDEDIVMNALTDGVTKSYERYLLDKGLTLNTVSFYMRVLRRVYRKAVHEGLCRDRQPFEEVYTGIAKTRKRALSVEDISRLVGLQTKGEGETLARDMFMLSFYLRGMSFVDLCALRLNSIRHGILVYQRRKTGQRLEIAWTKEMQEIVDRHPSLDGSHLVGLINDKEDLEERSQIKRQQASVGYYLRKVGCLAGLSTRLTMYVARHSWASIAQEMDVPMGIISDGMGHNSQRTTQIYLDSIDANKIDKVNSEIIKRVLFNS